MPLSASVIVLFETVAERVVLDDPTMMSRFELSEKVQFERVLDPKSFVMTP